MKLHSQLAKTLTRDLPGDHVVVMRPDHPHQFAGPDLLVGARGTLSAVFWQSEVDGSRSDDLLARLIAARLSLPSRTQCVLVVKKEAATPNASVVENFPYIVDDQSHADLLRIIGAAPGASIRGVPLENKKLAFARFALLTQFMTIRTRTKSAVAKKEATPLLSLKGGETDAVVLDPLLETQGYIEKPKGVLVGEPFAVAAMRWGDISRRFITETRSLCVYSFRSEFVLDRGVPYPKNLSPNILALDRLPKSQLVHRRGFRPLAFAGWATLAVNDIDELKVAQERLGEAAKRRNFV